MEAKRRLITILMENDCDGIRTPIVSYDHNSMSIEEVQGVIVESLKDRGLDEYLEEKTIKGYAKELAYGNTVYDDSSVFYTVTTEFVELTKNG